MLLMQSGQNSESAAEAEVSQPTRPFSGAAGGAYLRILPRLDRQPSPSRMKNRVQEKCRSPVIHQ